MGDSNDMALKLIEGILAKLRKDGASELAAKARQPAVDPAALGGAGESPMPDLSDDDLAAIESASGESPMPDEDDENPFKKH